MTILGGFWKTKRLYENQSPCTRKKKRVSSQASDTELKTDHDGK